MFVFYQGSME